MEIEIKKEIVIISLLLLIIYTFVFMYVVSPYLNSFPDTKMIEQFFNYSNNQF